MARRRRSAEEARAEILAIAQQRLVEAGPDGLRLDEIAAEIGVSRQAVLHHFGSREGLLREVVRLAWLGLFDDLNALVQDAGAFGPSEFIDRVDDVARRKGNARLGGWLLLSGAGLPESTFAGALSELPTMASDAADEASLREQRFRLLLVGAALFGDAIFGTRLRQSLGVPDNEDERAAFHRWLAELLWP